MMAGLAEQMRGGTAKLTEHTKDLPSPPLPSPCAVLCCAVQATTTGATQAGRSTCLAPLRPPPPGPAPGRCRKPCGAACNSPACTSCEGAGMWVGRARWPSPGGSPYQLSQGRAPSSHLQLSQGRAPSSDLSSARGGHPHHTSGSSSSNQLL